MRATEERQALVRSYGLLAGGLTLGLALLYAAVPSARSALALEDRILENASVVIYAAAVAVALVAARRRAGRSPAAAWLIALLAAVAALDEIDWGRRLLDLDMPEVEGVQIDTSQRLAKALLLLVVDHGGHVALGALALLCAVAAYRYRQALSGLARGLAGSLAFKFVLLWLLLGLLAAVPDNVLERSRSVVFVEELIELCATLALLWAALALTGVGARRAPAAGAPI